MNITHMRIYSKHVTNMSEEIQETGVLLEKLKQIQNLHSTVQKFEGSKIYNAFEIFLKKSLMLTNAAFIRSKFE